MSVKNNTLLISHTDSNAIYWYDLKTLKLVKRNYVRDPRGVHLLGDDLAYVISEKKVQLFDRNGFKKDIITSNLSDPKRISVAEDERIFVTDGYPKTSVKKFSSSGAYRRRLGSSHGRNIQGTYDKTNYLGVTDIATDAKDGYFVAEPLHAPIRIAHADEGGSILHEWYGGQPYYTWSEFEPHNPNKVWFNSYEGLVRAEIDFRNNSWKVLETYDLKKMAKGLMKDPIPFTDKFQILRRNKTTYLVSEENPHVFIHEPGSLKPVLATGHSVTAGMEQGSLNDEWKLVKKLSGHSGSFKAYKWLDANRDGIPDPKEFTFTTQDIKPEFDSIGPNFEGVATDQYQGSTDVVISRPTWRDGIPDYPIHTDDGLAVKAATFENHFPVRVSTRGTGSYLDSDSNVYMHTVERTEESHGDGTHANFGTRAWGGRTRLAKFNSRGKLQWEVGRGAIKGGLGDEEHLKHGSTPPGRMHVPMNVVGEVFDAVVVADKLESPGIFWSKDGLYIGRTFDYRKDDNLPDSVYSWWRDSKGNDAISSSDCSAIGDIHQLNHNTALFSLQGRNNALVYKINGWDAIEKAESSFRFNGSSKISFTGNGAKQVWFDEPDMSRKLSDSIVMRIWMGTSDTNHKLFHPLLDGREGAKTDWRNKNAHKFGTRYSFKVKAPLTEVFNFSVYKRGKVRVWLDGNIIMDAWNLNTDRVISDDISLVAGKYYSIQIDYAYVGRDMPKLSWSKHISSLEAITTLPGLSFMWESESMERSRVETKYMYSDSSSMTDIRRPASDKIYASSFVELSDYDAAQIQFGKIYGFATATTNARDFHAHYQRINFGNGGYKYLRLKGGAAAKTDRPYYDVAYEVRLGSLSGPVLARVVLNGDVKEHRVRLKSNPTGGNDLYLVNATDPENVADTSEIHWFKFEK